MDRSTAPAITVALAGDTMLGRGVGERIAEDPTAAVVSSEVADAMQAADLAVLNLECCVSSRGEPFPEPGKPFFFRAPPQAAGLLAEQLGADAVSLANNHALDFGPDALLDTLDHLGRAGIACVGAGADRTSARADVTLDARGFRLRLVAVSDHPAAYAADADRPGIAYADLRSGRVPGWLLEAARPRPEDDAVLVTPHWGPNMRDRPVGHVQAAARALAATGATLIAGHSAHVFQGVSGNVLYDLGDFIDDYAVDERLRNDLGLLWFVTLDGSGVRRIEALPLCLDHCFTRVATGAEAAMVERLLRRRCALVGTEVERAADGRLAIQESIAS